jgi:hypothetical protein
MTRRDFSTLAVLAGTSEEPAEWVAIAGARLPESIRVSRLVPLSAEILERRVWGGETRWLEFESLEARESAWDRVAGRGGDPSIGEFTLFRRK